MRKKSNCYFNLNYLNKVLLSVVLEYQQQFYNQLEFFMIISMILFSLQTCTHLNL